MFAVENCFNEKENYHVRGRKLFALCFFKYIKKETDHVRGRKGNDQGLEFLHRAPTLKMMLIMMMLVMIMTMFAPVLVCSAPFVYGDDVYDDDDDDDNYDDDEDDLMK